MPEILQKPDLTAIQNANHPKAETVFSVCFDESIAAGQTVTVRATFEDGSLDIETARLGPHGDWVASEIVSEAEERLRRVLSLRHARKSNPNPK